MLKVLLGLLAVAATCSAIKVQPLKCRISDFVIPASAENVDIPTDLDLLSLDNDALTKLTANLPKRTVSGEYKIVGRFCDSTTVLPSRYNTLEILVHGGTYTKDYWSGLAAPGKGINGTYYSWPNYAAGLGYSTLAIDRICNGDSEHADGLTECQLPLSVAIINKIIEKARAGDDFPRQFSKIIVVGHSIGSLTTNILARDYPDAADAIILTGYTSSLALGTAPIITKGKFVPVTIGPKRFRYINDPNYIVATDKPGITSFFYYGDYSAKVASLDYKTRGTATTGELATVFLGELPVPQYKKAVFVVNGQEDAPFCGDPVEGHNDCGHGSTSFSAVTQTLFPNAQVYAWKQLPKTGHDINLHYSARKQFLVAHEFLSHHGF